MDEEVEGIGPESNRRYGIPSTEQSEETKDVVVILRDGKEDVVKGQLLVLAVLLHYAYRGMLYYCFIAAIPIVAALVFMSVVVEFYIRGLGIAALTIVAMLSLGLCVLIWVYIRVTKKMDDEEIVESAAGVKEMGHILSDIIHSIQKI